MAASSSSLAGNHEIDRYEVFISFRGFDVRQGFLSHLYPALKAKQIHAFIDNDLERGNDITGNLFQIIEQSDLSIVIFSQNYPKSEWCLEELEKIHECMKQGKQIVVPVFYEVDPSNVQDLIGNYAIQLQKWRDALVEISNLSGFDSRNSINDAKLIEDIVFSVSTKLKEICPSISHEEGLFGIDSCIKDVESLLCLDSIDDVKMVGIWGMGGIGKTTIASKVCERIKKKFGGHCFVSNVRETLSARDGLISLRDKIICQLLGDKDIKMESLFSVDDSARRRLKRIRVLLVLDDVHTCMQLNSLLKTSGLYSPESFYPGSRIIVTSRDSLVLRDVKLRSDIYEAKALKDIEALHLLCWHAFGQNYAHKGYEKLAEKVVRYSHGVPLAVVVLGCELKQKATSHWEDALKKFNTISPGEIQKILRISFDGLDRDEKNIFLYIACFFKGNKIDYVVNMLEAFGFHARVGISRLVDKSLLKEEEEEGIITMHDLLEQMGKEIVAEEKDSNEHGSRLWNLDEIEDALTNNRGTKNVEAISLQGSFHDKEIEINPVAFIHMCKLWFLKFKFKFKSLSVNCQMGVEFLPKSIKYLHWDYFPQRYWPPSFNLEKLVELHMISSQLDEIIWSKPLVSLKLISLRGSRNLIKISDLAMAPNLEVVDLSYCDSLVEVGSFLVKLSKLTKLNVQGCKSLSHLPELPLSIKEMELDFSGLRQLPWTFGCLTQLKQLSLSFCEYFEILPTSISSLISLEVLCLSNCSRFIKIGLSLENLTKLTRLDVRGCTSFSLLPELPTSIVELLLSSTGLSQLPSTTGCLTRLKHLSLASCVKLESLPSSICNLTSLEKLNLLKCKSLQKLPKDFGNLKSLKLLYADKSGLTKLPRSIQNLKKLIRLDLTDCKELKDLPPLPSNLEEFYANHCRSQFTEVKSSLVEQYRLQVHDKPTQIRRLCVDDARMEVPKWMMYRSDSGTSISLNLKTFGHSVTFVFCVVVSSYLAPIIPVATLISRTHQSFPYPDRGLIRLHFRRFDTCLILWNCNDVECQFVKEVSFRFKYASGSGRIVKCGVHPIFHNKKFRKRPHPDNDEGPNVHL